MTPGYWVWFIEEVKALLDRGLLPEEYSLLMKQYIKGVKPEQAIKEIQQ